MNLSHRRWGLLMYAALSVAACSGDDGPDVTTTGSPGGGSSAGGHGASTGGGAEGGSGGAIPDMCSETVVDCDPSVMGCETDITSDSAHCGGCGSACGDVPNAVVSCVDQMCDFSCTAGTGNCNDEIADGCETDTDQSNTHCGACGVPCEDATNADAACVDGVCEQTCGGNWDDCNNDLSDGCEQGIFDVSHCGACNVVCPAENGTAQCERGSCTVLLGQSPTAVHDLDVSGGYVYFAASASGIYRLPADGGAAESIVSGSSEVDRFVEVEGSVVYYPVIVGGSVVIRSVPVTGGTPADVTTVAATGPSVGGFAVGPTHAFVTVNDELWTVALAGGTAVSVATTDSAPVVANGLVYYLHGSTHTLRAAPEAGGAEVVVSSEVFGSSSYATHLAVNGTHAFVGNSNLQRVTLATGVTAAAGGFFFFASALTADDSYVYDVAAYDVGANLYQSLSRQPVLAAVDEALTHDRESATAALVLDATHIYFALGTGIEKMPK